MAKIGRPKTGYFRNCEVCNTPFWVFPNWAARRVAQYCSHKCAGVARRKPLPAKSEFFLVRYLNRVHWLKWRGIDCIESQCGRLYKRADVKELYGEESDTDEMLEATCLTCGDLYLGESGAFRL